MFTLSQAVINDNALFHPYGARAFIPTMDLHSKSAFHNDASSACLPSFCREKKRANPTNRTEAWSSSGPSQYLLPTRRLYCSFVFFLSNASRRQGFRKEQKGQSVHFEGLIQYYTEGAKGVHIF